MSWYGTHVIYDWSPVYGYKHQTLKTFLPPGACKLCKYRAELHSCGKIQFGPFKCTRCGINFPTEQLDREYFFRKLRSQFPNREKQQNE